MSEPSDQNGELALSARKIGRYGATRLATDHRLVAVGDLDVHLGAADQLFPGEQLVIGEHPAVARGLGDLYLGRDRQRYRTRSGNPHAELRRGVAQHPAVGDEIVAQSAQVGEDAAVGFHDTALQFLDVDVVGQQFEQFGCAGGEAAGGRIDELELFFDAEIAQFLVALVLVSARVHSHSAQRIGGRRRTADRKLSSSR